MNPILRMKPILPLLALLLGWSPLASALSTDRQQPAYIEADRAELDDRTGVSIYIGNVRITQGSMRLTADRLTVHSEDGEIVKAHAVGSPATFRQRPDGKDTDVEAEALEMDYLAREGRIVLMKKAEVRQDGDRFRSERIVYDLERDQVNAGGGGNDRVRIILQPRQQP